MTCLHIISGSPTTGLLASCSSLLKPGDALLFIEDGIYYCIGDDIDRPAKRDISIYALGEDLAARGLSDRSTKVAELTNYDGFVRLCCQYEKVVSWF